MSLPKTRVAIAALATATVLILAVCFVRWQPSGSATVLRRDQSIRLVEPGLALAWRPGADACELPFRDGIVELEHQSDSVAELGEVGVTSSLWHRPPGALDESWPAGSYCAALGARLDNSAAHWLQTVSPSQLITPGAEEDLRTTLAADLRGAGIDLRRLAVRLTVPESLAALTPDPTLESLRGAGGPVIFVGLDGGDWHLLDRLVAAGDMPELQRLVAEGRRGVLNSEHPPLSPLLWTTMMTGVGPLEHGVLDFTRYNPANGQREPITSNERRRPAIWTMATGGGLDAAVFGMWATYPAEPVRGVLVSDRLFTFLFSETTTPPGAVFPPARESWARETLAAAETSVDFERLHAYLPWLERQEYNSSLEASDPYSQPVSALRRILVETELYHRLATEILESEPPDLTVLYIQGTDSIGHTFARYAPPRLPGVDERDFARFSTVPRQYFRYIDTLLGEYRRLAEARSATLFLASDHGFRWSEGRPVDLSSYAKGTAARWHRKEGIYLLWGNGVSARRQGAPAELRQVAPTLLRLLGLPPAAAQALPSIVDPGGAGEPFDYDALYEPPAEVATSGDPAAADQELAKLEALGYLAGRQAEHSVERGETRTAGAYNNQGLILRQEGHGAEARVAFEKALGLDPDLASALWNLSDELFAADQDLDRSDELLARAFAHGLPEGRKFLIGRAIGYHRAGRGGRAVTLLDKAIERVPGDPELFLFRGRYRIDAGNCAAARQDFERATDLAPEMAEAHTAMGLAAACLGDAAAAARSLRTSLSIQPNQPAVRRMLSQLGAEAGR